MMQAPQPAQPERFLVPPQAEGDRLDRVVACWRGLSRAAVLRLLDHGAIACNGRAMSRKNKGDLLRGGEWLELLGVYTSGEVPLEDPARMLDLLAEGDGWLAVNKPAGTPVRPHALDETGAVLNAVVARSPQVVGVGEGGLRSGVVHRLDTDTSGAVLFATSQQAWDRLRLAFSEHRIEKRYIALVHGLPEEQGGARRDLSITTHKPARVKVEPEGAGGSDARLCSLGWRVVERFDDRASLIEVDLHTGFLHQVRAMMADLGHPVVGDRTYVKDTHGLTTPRQMLHAESLVFEEINAKAALPDDMVRVVEKLRG